MNVELFDCTGMGAPDPAEAAANVLIFTKGTRLGLTPARREEIMRMAHEEKLKELEYIANTVPSSWEFLHYSFLIQDVSRVFTHQLVRTRTASYAQQSMRIIDMAEGEAIPCHMGPSIHKEGDEVIFRNCLGDIKWAYKALINRGVRVEDARDLLPNGVLTNICVSMNLRTLVDLCRKRSTLRVQEEYHKVLDGMKMEALAAHPFLSLFLERTQDQAAKELDAEIAAIPFRDKRERMMKLLQQVRTS